ncbi:flavin reductase family protein [Hyphomicrobium methylovorum]|uniref:flavin reductase family protein n=1 Tax=Hyphomicrobium methylovorum TaxID=84 RepID=UPI0015E757C3|nr:flavin reductase family protein [Hyphomicrobium methylovorum]MBA2125912.1 flavin reductase family protein [Hyphomicrobium methylovorum]
MELDFEQLAPDDRYKILTSTIVPRPIAWVTTLSKNGVGNTAPFSFFNAMSKAPPLLALGLQADSDGSMKDSARNILDTGEFVVNLVPSAAIEAMNLTSIDAPPDIDELALAGLETVASTKVRPRRIAVSPVAFECRLHTPLEVAKNQLVVLGEIVAAHVDDAFILDAEKFYVDTLRLGLVGRMHGGGWYCAPNASSAFQVERPAPFATRANASTLPEQKR